MQGHPLKFARSRVPTDRTISRRPITGPVCEELEQRLTPSTLPHGFSESLVANVYSATAMEFAPDGRLFVAQQDGNLRVIKDGTLLDTPRVNSSNSLQLWQGP